MQTYNLKFVFTASALDYVQPAAQNETRKFKDVETEVISFSVATFYLSKINSTISVAKKFISISMTRIDYYSMNLRNLSSFT